MHNFENFSKVNEAKLNKSRTKEMGIKEDLDEGKQAKYPLHHKDFSGAMKTAYDHAKKNLGVIVDPSEIDDKVAMGPRKPSTGKTNSYRLTDKSGKKAIQVQVYNTGKSYELNMYKEEVQLDELNASEKKLINTMYDKKGNLTPLGKKVMNHGKKIESVEEAFGRANFTQQLKKKGIDVNKMHSNNMKDADASKKRSAAAKKDLADYRKKTGVTSESKDEKFEPHMMYDPKTGEGKMAKKEADHLKMKKMGWSYDNPKTDSVEESKNALTTPHADDSVVVIQGPGDNNQKIVKVFKGSQLAMAKKYRDEWNTKNADKIKKNKNGKPIPAHMARLYKKPAGATLNGKPDVAKVGNKVSWSSFNNRIIKEESKLDEARRDLQTIIIDAAKKLLGKATKLPSQGLFVPINKNRVFLLKQIGDTVIVNSPSGSNNDKDWKKLSNFGGWRPKMEIDIDMMKEEVELDEGTKLKDAINLAKKTLKTSDRFTSMIGIFNKGSQFIPGEIKFRDKMAKDGYQYIGTVNKDGSVSLKKGFKESLDEALSPQQISKMKKQYANTGDRISIEASKKMSAMVKKFGDEELVQLAKADIKWISTSAITALIIKGKAKLLDESFDLDEVAEETDIDEILTPDLAKAVKSSGLKKFKDTHFNVKKTKSDLAALKARLAKMK